MERFGPNELVLLIMVLIRIAIPLYLLRCLVKHLSTRKTKKDVYTPPTKTSLATK